MSNAISYANQVLNKVNKLSAPKFSLEKFCFDKQLEFINDPKPFKIAVCSRRAGKTVGCAAHLIHAALSKDGVVCLYITLSRLNAKKIIWPELCEINRRHGLQGKVNESELSITFPNRSTLFLSGAKDQKEIEKFRGLALYLCYIDECQSFRPYIQNLVDEVISKALFDHNGTLCLTGTPGPVPSGFFYDCSVNPEWSNHGWTMFQNPWLQRKSGKTPSELVERELKRKGISLDDPTIQRECFGKWVIDTNALVFKYDRTRNHYDTIPVSPVEWRFIIGVDLGFDDADAIAVLGYNERLNAAYLFEERVESKQGITELVAQISALTTKYKPDRIVMDTGGLGKKIAEEITMRYAIMIEPAEKARKFEFIEILNDAMRTDRFYAKRESRFAQDSMILEWDKDPEIKNEKPKIRDSYHSDICDAVLYAFRECYHWLFEPQPEKIIPQTPAWLKRQEEEMEEAAIKSFERTQTDDPWSEALSEFE